ncbi:1-acyl-sn-glycerol-3-phosphate acyltransferase [Acrasis kona]|uniref:1-acyl-sn-glycerol-3-phosphate acyltransferase n=1 Tax=Acrasis kona TaxID=1008807 RepID=A0AAW2YVI4_9EUKA
MGDIRKNKAVSIFFSIWGWLTIILLFILTFPFQFLTWLVTYYFDPQRYCSGVFFRGVIVLWCKYLNPMWSFNVYEKERVKKIKLSSKTIFVCNHSSISDPILVSMLPFEMKFLTKSSVFNVPIFGWMQRFSGDIGIVRTERDSIKNAMTKCKSWIDKGVPVIFFPEGTRSHNDVLLPFKDGAFRLAIETGADVLPLALAGSAPAIRRGSLLMGFSVGNITAGTPISTKNYKFPDDIEKLKEETRKQMESLLEKIRPLSTTIPPILNKKKE